MTIIYNNEQHQELVKLAIELNKQGKCIYKENPKEDRGLSWYDNIVIGEIYWAYSPEFVTIIKNLLTTNIDFEEFDDTFSSIRTKAQRDYHLLHRDLKQIENFTSTFSTTRELFRSAIDSIYRSLELVEDEYSSEQEVTSDIKEICLRQQIFKDEIEIWT